MGISAQDVYAMMTPAQKEALNLQNQLRMFGGSPAYGPGVTPYNRGGVTNFGSGQGFGLGLGGEGNVAANESQTVQGIRAGLSNTAQNALAPHAPGPVTSQDVFNALDPAAKAVLQSKLAALYGGGIGHPALGYNTAAATAAHFGDPRAGPSAPVAAPSNVALAQRGGSNAVSMMGPGGPNAPSAYASNMAAFGAPTGFSQMMSQNIASNMGLGGQASVSTGGGMNRVGSDYSGQLMGGLHL
jgi:hypothetical protein